MRDQASGIDTALGIAVRAARFSRGLTQRDLADHLGVTRATIASYETGRRKLPAETLIHIARLCDKPLAFFAPPERSPVSETTRMRTTSAVPASVEQPAVQALIAALQLRPDALPVVMDFLELWLRNQQARGM